MAPNHTDQLLQNNERYAAGQALHEPRHPGRQKIQPVRRGGGRVRAYVAFHFGGQVGRLSGLVGSQGLDGRSTAGVPRLPVEPC